MAVTYGPGLIGAVLVGSEFRQRERLWPWIFPDPGPPCMGHIAANYITYPDLKPPLRLPVRLRRTTLVVDVRSYTEMKVLGGTRDDAAGSALIRWPGCWASVTGGGPHGPPGGRGDDSRYELPSTHVSGHELDMSFLALKTASLNLIHNAEQKGETWICGTLRPASAGR